MTVTMSSLWQGCQEVGFGKQDDDIHVILLESLLLVNNTMKYTVNTTVENTGYKIVKNTIEK